MFFKKDKNRINGGFISDTVIGMALSQMGQDKESVMDYIGRSNEIIEKEVTGDLESDDKNDKILILITKMSNGCIVSFSFGKKGVYKIITYLNNKLSKDDIRNIEAFYALKKNKFKVCYDCDSKQEYRIIVETNLQELLNSIPLSFRNS